MGILSYGIISFGRAIRRWRQEMRIRSGAGRLYFVTMKPRHGTEMDSDDYEVLVSGYYNRLLT